MSCCREKKKKSKRCAHHHPPHRAARLSCSSPTPPRCRSSLCPSASGKTHPAAGRFSANRKGKLSSARFSTCSVGRRRAASSGSQFELVVHVKRTQVELLLQVCAGTKAAEPHTGEIVLRNTKALAWPQQMKPSPGMNHEGRDPVDTDALL